jgi:hypothetical protein
MDPNISLLLAGRVALETLPPDGRPRRPTAKRSRAVVRLLTGIVDRAFKVRWRVTGPRTEDMAAKPHGRELSNTSAKEMS